MQVTTYWLEHAWLGTHVEPGVSLDVAATTMDAPLRHEVKRDGR
ncbi:hypothetical protein ACFWZY_07240 [Streptomyces sp. NPDC058992]